MTAPRNLDQLTSNAENIIQCTVVGARVEPHPQFKNLQTVVITIRVKQTLKGQVKSGETLTFRQFIWDIRDRRDAAGYMQMGELLLFLNKDNVNGLTSPVGLGQGRFHIILDKSGVQTAVNESNNISLFRNTGEAFRKRSINIPAKLKARVDQPSGGPVPLEDFKSLVQQLAGGSAK